MKKKSTGVRKSRSRWTKSWGKVITLTSIPAETFALAIVKSLSRSYEHEASLKLLIEKDVITEEEFYQKVKDEHQKAKETGKVLPGDFRSKAS